MHGVMHNQECGISVSRSVSIILYCILIANSALRM